MMGHDSSLKNAFLKHLGFKQPVFSIYILSRPCKDQRVASIHMLVLERHERVQEVSDHAVTNVVMVVLLVQRDLGGVHSIICWSNADCKLTEQATCKKAGDSNSKVKWLYRD